MTADSARRAVRRAIDATGMDRTSWAAKAGVDPGTLGDYLAGKRRPQPKTLRKIETQLGWDAGTIDDIAEAPDVPPAAGPVSVEDAILTDPRLLPEARAHLLNQYQLLLRLQASPPDPSLLREQEARRQEADIRAAARAAAAETYAEQTERVTREP